VLRTQTSYFLRRLVTLTAGTQSPDLVCVHTPLRLTYILAFLLSVTYIAVGDRIFWGCKILILPKSNQICPNLITFAQISPQFCPNLFTFGFALIWLNFAQILPNLPKFNQFCSKKYLLGAVHKRRPQLGEEGGLSSADILRTRGRWFFRCGRPHFLAQKTSNFLKFMVYLHGQGGFSHCGHFSDKEEGGQFFAILCGPLLWTASKGMQPALVTNILSLQYHQIKQKQFCTAKLCPGS